MGTVLVRVYAPARRALARAMRVVQIMFDGVWLGLLSPGEQAAIDERFYRHHGDAAAPEPAYGGADHNLGGLSDWEQRVVDHHFRPGCRVVVTSAGGGREVIALAEQGFRVAGYEPNPALVAAGRRLLAGRRLETASLQASSRDVFPPGATACDAVVVGWGSYIHVRGRGRRVALLKGARARMREGDPLLVSFWQRPPADRYFSRVLRVASALRPLRGLEAPELGDTVRDSYVHWFVREEVESELVQAGFSMVEYRTEPYAHAVGIAV